MLDSPLRSASIPGKAEDPRVIPGSDFSVIPSFTVDFPNSIYKVPMAGNSPIQHAPNSLPSKLTFQQFFTLPDGEVIRHESVIVASHFSCVRSCFRSIHIVPYFSPVK